MRGELGLDPVAIDVGSLVQRTVASLYSHLVTRPTGRAVRTAIEAQLAESRTSRALSLIDFSEVKVLDFSCADEVVAKLILRFVRDVGGERGRAFFVFLGVGEQHRDPIEAVLERHELVTVGETAPGRFELLGPRPPPHASVWNALEARGRVGRDDLPEAFPRERDRRILGELASRHLVFHRPDHGDFHALSTLVRDLP